MSSHLGGTCIAITNSRLNTAKRGIAVEVGARVAAETRMPVCLVAADPTDRDVARHLPKLVAAWGTPTRMQVNRGPHQLEVANFERAGVCVVSVSDRESIELVLPSLQARFRYVVIDAPSRTGTGVGIADVLLDWLDGLVVATGLTAGELAETRQYFEHIDSWPSARNVDVRVVTVGEPDESGLAHAQLDARLAALPTIGHIPRLGGRAAHDGAIDADELDGAFRPVIQWIVHGRARQPQPPPAVAPDPPTAPLEQHVANRLYRASEREGALFDR